MEGSCLKGMGQIMSSKKKKEAQDLKIQRVQQIAKISWMVERDNLCMNILRCKYKTEMIGFERIPLPPPPSPPQEKDLPQYGKQQRKPKHWLQKMPTVCQEMILLLMYRCTPGSLGCLNSNLSKKYEDVYRIPMMVSNLLNIELNCQKFTSSRISLIQSQTKLFLGFQFP